MNTIIKSGRSTKSSQQKAAKIAGLMFLFAFIVPTLNWAFILSNIIIAEDAITTAKNILTNQLMFRIGIFIELMMCIGLVVLGVTLYSILKSVNRDLALIAYSLKLVEATIAVCITLGSFITMLLMADDGVTFTVYNQELLQAVSGFFLQKHTVLYSIPMLFLGLNMMIFSYLLCKSKYIPTTLARFGMISFALIFIHALMYILAPEYAARQINQIIFWTPSGLFEIIIGVWLLVKGIKN